MLLASRPIPFTGEVGKAGARGEDSVCMPLRVSHRLKSWVFAAKRSVSHRVRSISAIRLDNHQNPGSNHAESSPCLAAPKRLSENGYAKTGYTKCRRKAEEQLTGLVNLVGGFGPNG